jgi:sterol O-acyltransferase
VTGLVVAGALLHEVYLATLWPRVARESGLLLLLDAALPITGLALVCFFVTFEGVCNTAAEVTYTADRRFYDAWYDATTFLEFSRTWNLPVHEWLREHVFARAGLTATFLLSIAAHEVALAACLGRGWRVPWLAAASLCQLPLAPLMRAPALKGKRLGNVFFWCGLVLGTTAVVILYARDVEAARAAQAQGARV